MRYESKYKRCDISKIMIQVKPLHGESPASGQKKVAVVDTWPFWEVEV